MENGMIVVSRRKSSRGAVGAQCTQFLLTLLLLVLLRESAAIPNLRGVATQDGKYYQTAIIKCKDGSKTFSQERLNDDFCDCVDGTDEPGTNACPNGKFHCKNLGHKPVQLFSSRVNDGICDCCDGSDEFDGKMHCPNTCRESGKQSTEKLKKKLATFKEGATIRNRDVENTQKLREKHETELRQRKEEQKTLKRVVAKLKVEKEAVEKQEQEEKKKERREKERQEKREKQEQERSEKETAMEKEKPEQEEEEAQSQVEVLPESPKEMDGGRQDSSCLCGYEEQGVSKPLEGMPVVTVETAPADADIEGLDHLTEAERGRVIASRWTGEDVSDILSKEVAPEHQIDDEDDDHEDPVLLHENDKDNDYDSSDFTPLDAFSPELTDSEHSSWWSRLSILPEYFVRLFRVNRPPVDKSEAERIRKEYQESFDKLVSIESKIDELEMRIGQDFGMEGEFYGFYDSCFELTDKKYTYKVCPFNDATQGESHSTTRLGRWEGFKEDYKEMIFQHGDKCWNGPERSLRVKMRCGSKLELRSVEEPSRCEYVGEFSTPTLCTPSKVQALEQQLLQNDPESLLAHDEL